MVDTPDSEASSATQSLVPIAQRIAREVRGSGALGAIRTTKVSSLLQTFRTEGGPSRWSDVVSALGDLGIRLELGNGEGIVQSVQRASVVRLCEDDPTLDHSSEHPFINASRWSADSLGLELSLSQARRLASEFDGDREVICFDIEPLPLVESPQQHVPQGRFRSGAASIHRHGPTLVQDEAKIAARAEECMELLGPSCEGLELGMLLDLLHEDMQPKVDAYGNEQSLVRGVSVVGAISQETATTDQRDGLSEEIVFQLVEILVGDGWMITCWHHSQVVAGATKTVRQPPLLKEPFLERTRYRLRTMLSDANSEFTSGDLGLLLTRSIIDTYKATHRMVERWTSAWEVNFYKAVDSPDKREHLQDASTEIANALYVNAEIRRRLTAFHHARLNTSDESWFPGVNDERRSTSSSPDKPSQFEALLKTEESARDSFDQIAKDIQSNMDLLMLQSSATQQESNDRLQGMLGKVAGLILMPTFVAGLFGANTRLPGGGNWFGFELMLVLMVISSAGVYFAIRKMTK